MILFKKWAKRPNVKLNYIYIYRVNQFLHEKRHKTWNHEYKQRQSPLFRFCNIFDLLTCRSEKLVWWPPVFKPNLYIFSYNEHLRKIFRNFNEQVFIVSVTWKLSPRKLSPGWFPPDNSHPENFHQRKFPPRINLTWTIPIQESSHPENSDPENSHPENSQPENSHPGKLPLGKSPPKNFTPR